MEKKIYIVSNFRLDIDRKLPSDMMADDLVCLFRDGSTSVLDSYSLAKSKKKRCKAKYLYTLCCSGRK